MNILKKFYWSSAGNEMLFKNSFPPDFRTFLLGKKNIIDKQRVKLNLLCFLGVL